MRGREYAELEAFVAVVEEGNFRRAAARLRISASSLSQTIGNLEDRLGVNLLQRTTRSTSLTEPGKRLFERFRPAMAEMAFAVEDIMQFQGRPAGTVRLLLPRLALATQIEPWLGAFHEKYPDVVLELVIEDAPLDIVDAGYDLGITLGELLQKDMVAVRLGPDIHQLAVASPDYLARYGVPQTPADLHGHKCINWRKPGRRKLYNWEFCVDGRWISVAVDGPLIVSHRDTALKAAAQGVGIAFAYWSSRWMQPMIDDGALVPVLEDYSPPFPGWYLYYPKQRATPPAVRALIDFLRHCHQESRDA